MYIYPRTYVCVMHIFPQNPDRVNRRFPFPISQQLRLDKSVHTVPQFLPVGMKVDLQPHPVMTVVGQAGQR